MATASPLVASNPDRNNCLSHNSPKATKLPHIASSPNEDNLNEDNPNEDNRLQQTTSRATTLSTPPSVTTTNDWDDIDPVTGLSKEYTTAMEIIDSCDYAELRRFNALLLGNQTMTVGQKIEMYYNGGVETEEHRRKREELMMTTTGAGEGKRASTVAERVAAIMAFWKRPHSMHSMTVGGKGG